MELLYFLVAFLCVNSSFARQYYDGSDCSSGQTKPGSRYTCNNVSQNPCETFLVYRANQDFNTISKISALFNATPNSLLSLNNATSSSSSALREVLVPVSCSCSGRFSQSNLRHVASETASLSRVACGVFEGLVTALALAEANALTWQNDVVEAGSNLRVPLKCACPDESESRKGIKYLVTYPLVEGDGTIVVSEKFGVSPEELWEANHFESRPTVYPFTTVLVPLRDTPVIDLNIVAGSPPPTAGFLPTFSVEKQGKSSKTRSVFIAGSVVGLFLVIVVIILLVLYVRALNKWKGKIHQNNFSDRVYSPILSTAARRSSVCLSPDLLEGFKFSLKNYSVEAIKLATSYFAEENKLGCEVYKGVMDNGATRVMIKRMRFGETHRVIDVHSKINHVNIVKLLGICHEDSTTNSSLSYLVFECPENGTLRDCLSSLRWPQRARIAFDVATGLHYLHRCIFPSHAHGGVGGGNIFVTADFRAKLGAIGGGEAGEGEKDDVLALGVVLWELISGRDQGGEGERVGFLEGGGEGGGEGGCLLEKMRSFMDPCLNEDNHCSLAEALCLSVLAKACLENDPLNRPSMDDIIKLLSRMV